MTAGPIVFMMSSLVFVSAWVGARHYELSSVSLMGVCVVAWVLMFVICRVNLSYKEERVMGWNIGMERNTAIVLLSVLPFVAAMEIGVRLSGV